MSKLDEIIYRIGSPWGEGATYDKSRTPESFKEEGLEPSSHMSWNDEAAMKEDIKALMLELIGGEDHKPMFFAELYAGQSKDAHNIRKGRNEYISKLRQKVEEL